MRDSELHEDTPETEGDRFAQWSEGLGIIDRFREEYISEGRQSGIFEEVNLHDALEKCGFDTTPIVRGKILRVVPLLGVVFVEVDFDGGKELNDYVGSPVDLLVRCETA